MDTDLAARKGNTAHHPRTHLLDRLELTVLTRAIATAQPGIEFRAAYPQRGHRRLQLQAAFRIGFVDQAGHRAHAAAEQLQYPLILAGVAIRLVTVRLDLKHRIGTQGDLALIGHLDNGEPRLTGGQHIAFKQRLIDAQKTRIGGGAVRIILMGGGHALHIEHLTDGIGGHRQRRMDDGGYEYAHHGKLKFHRYAPLSRRLAQPAPPEMIPDD